MGDVQRVPLYRRVMSRQREADRGTLPLALRLRPDRAAMRLDDPLDSGKPDAGAGIVRVTRQPESRRLSILPVASTKIKYYSVFFEILKKM